MTQAFMTEIGLTLSAHAIVTGLTLAGHISHVANVAKAWQALHHSKVWVVMSSGTKRTGKAVGSAARRIWRKHVLALVTYKHQYETALVLTLLLAVAGELSRAAIAGTWLYAFAETLVTGREG